MLAIVRVLGAREMEHGILQYCVTLGYQVSLLVCMRGERRRGGNACGEFGHVFSCANAKIL